MTPNVEKQKRILVIGAAPEGSLAVSELAKATFSSDNWKNSFLNFYCYDIQEKRFSDADHETFLEKSPFRGMRHWPIRILRKFKTMLRLDTGLASSKFAQKRIGKLYGKSKIDAVIAVGGLFSLVEAAFHFAREQNIPFTIIYVDPFTESQYAKGHRRLKVEKRWLSYATSVFYDADGIKPPLNEFDYKKKPFFIPISDPVACLPDLEPIIIYGGSFYPGLRDVNDLQPLISRKDMKNYRFHVYSNLGIQKSKGTTSFFSSVEKNQFNDLVAKSMALIVIGNKTSQKSQPSKFLYGISQRKILIGINLGQKKADFSRYPFYFDSLDPNLPQEIQKVTKDELLSFDVYGAFPERNPAVFAQQIQNSL
jgi:hypothetical protein